MPKMVDLRKQTLQETFGSKIDRNSGHTFSGYRHSLADSELKTHRRDTSPYLTRGDGFKKMILQKEKLDEEMKNDFKIEIEDPDVEIKSITVNDESIKSFMLRGETHHQESRKMFISVDPPMNKTMG